MVTALENHVARRQAADFQAQVQQALAEEKARMARTRAMLLGTAEAAAGVSQPGTDRSRRKDEACG